MKEKIERIAQYVVLSIICLIVLGGVGVTCYLLNGISSAEGNTMIEADMVPGPILPPDSVSTDADSSSAVSLTSPPTHTIYPSVFPTQSSDVFVFISSAPSESPVVTNTVDSEEVVNTTRAVDVVLTHKPKSAMDTDMCGKSLIEEALPHARIPDIMEAVFELYRGQYSRNSEESIYVLPEGYRHTDVILSIENEYRYLLYRLPFCKYSTGDDSDAISVYCEPGVTEDSEKIYGYADSILKDLKIDSSVTQKEAIGRINKWICDNKEYDYSDDPPSRGSVYYSLTGDKGICTNYALAFQTLCLSAGIECHYYNSPSMRHAWNKVYFSDGTYRWVDVCWNDVEGKETRYLLITDEQLLKDHIL